jgi:hypothetical protein
VRREAGDLALVAARLEAGHLGDVGIERAQRVEARHRLELGEAAVSDLVRLGRDAVAAAVDRDHRRVGTEVAAVIGRCGVAIVMVDERHRGRDSELVTKARRPEATALPVRRLAQRVVDRLEKRERPAKPRGAGPHVEQELLEAAAAQPEPAVAEIGVVRNQVLVLRRDRDGVDVLGPDAREFEHRPDPLSRHSEHHFLAYESLVVHRRDHSTVLDQGGAAVDMVSDSQDYHRCRFSIQSSLIPP